MFPWAREENHEEQPVHPLLEAGAFGGDDDACVATVGIDGGDEALSADGGEVDAQNVVEHPAGLAVDHVDRPNHQFVD